VTPAEPAEPVEPVEPARRRYDSPVRRQRAAQTRDRIVGAGAAILHDHAIWNWDALTVRAVAARAGVSERTVYRHFASERDLRDAVLARLEIEAGVVPEGLRLDDLESFTEQVLEYVSSFPLEPRTTVRDPTLIAAHGRLRDALLVAVRDANAGWSARERTLAAAVLDVLWNVSSYERLVADWELDPKDAVAAVTWVIGLVADAIRADNRPSPTVS
jgi:AcrR family transcriptional regulator